MKLSELKSTIREEIINALTEAGEKTAFIDGNAIEYKDEKELNKFKDNQDVKSIKTGSGKKIKEEDSIEEIISKELEMNQTQLDEVFNNFKEGKLSLSEYISIRKTLQTTRDSLNKILLESNTDN